jgi:hypothetical protein
MARGQWPLRVQDESGVTMQITIKILMTMKRRSEDEDCDPRIFRFDAAGVEGKAG